MKRGLKGRLRKVFDRWYMSSDLDFRIFHWTKQKVYSNPSDREEAYQYFVTLKGK